jgi:hypothetical protein
MAYTDKSFFEKIKPMVIQDMRNSGILASLTAAQAFIESNKGNSGLTQKANNLFGIKGEYNGQSVTMPTTEYYNGVKCKINAKFRKYPSWQESISDHSGMFNRMDRYKNLRGCKDYRQACINVKNDGYATSPAYTQTLINTIEKYHLYDWDKEVLGNNYISKPKPIEKFEDLPTLKKGDKNAYVLNWQKYLNANDYPCGKEDGIFGPNTEEAVKQWQTVHGLKEDGIIGPKTWASIGVK